MRLATKVPQLPKTLKLLLVCVGAGVVVLLAAATVRSLVTTESQPSREICSQTLTEPPQQADLSQDPFAALTIPYLRSRNYSSSLAALEPLSTQATYQSYLTSYDSDGLQVHALLTIPNGEAPPGGWPAIVFIHGYIPPSQYRTEERYVSYVDALARSNFIVFKIDLRGHGNSEGTASGAYYSGDYIIDTLNARAALAASPFVNADRIGLWGHSMAGNVVLRAVAAQPEIPAAVIWAGAVYTYEDLQQNGISDSSYQRPSDTSQRIRDRELLRERHGTFDPTSEFWKQVVPTNYLSSVKTKLQVHHAENDTVVSPDYSKNLDSVLDSTDLEHEMWYYTSGGHDIEGSSFTQAMQRTVSFFTETL